MRGLGKVNPLFIYRYELGPEKQAITQVCERPFTSKGTITEKEDASIGKISKECTIGPMIRNA